MAAILRPTGTIQLAPWKCLNLFFNDNIYEKDVYQKQASCACDDSAFFSTFDLFGKMFHFAGLWCPNHLTHTNSWVSWGTDIVIYGLILNLLTICQKYANFTYNAILEAELLICLLLSCVSDLHFLCFFTHFSNPLHTSNFFIPHLL